MSSMTTTAPAPTAARDWWRRPPPASPEVSERGVVRAESASSRWAFRALLAFVVVNVLAPQSFLPALEPLRLAFLSAVAAAATHLADRWSRTDGPGAAPREAVLIWCLVGWALLTVPFSLWPGFSFSTLLDQYLKTVMVFWLVGNVVTGTARLRALFWTLAACTVPLALTGIHNFASGVTEGNDRIQGYTNGMASNPNDLALTLNIMIPLTMSLVLTARDRLSRIAGLGIIVVSVLGIIVTFSRGGFITLATIALLSLIALWRRGHTGVVGGMILAVLLAIPALPQGYLDRLATISNASSDQTGSSEERLELMSVALECVRSHPLLGSGLGMDVEAISRQGPVKGLHVHNAYLVCAVDLGIPGLLLFAGAIVAAIRTARRVEGPRARDDDELPTLAGGVRISLMAFAVAAFFHPVPYNAYLYYLAGLAAAAWQCRAASVRPLAAAPSSL